MARVTALLGAGAAIDIGAPSTADITKEVIKKRQGFGKGEMQYTLKGIHDVLNSYYHDHECNFEDIFHTLEMLLSYKAAWGKRTVYGHKPSIAAFVYPNRYFNKYISYAHLAESDLLNSVAKQVSIYDRKFKLAKNKESKWYSDFWNKNGLIWDIATLNYDTTIEESLGQYVDGFHIEKKSNFSRFYPSRLRRFHNKHTCIHLHGCIEYGYPYIVIEEPEMYLFEDNLQDLYKLISYKEACLTWDRRTQGVNQAGEINHIAPIITGLRKLEKQNAAPYSHYLRFFQNSILNNPCLLIVGYGFGDLYINQIMERMNIIHGDKKRIVVITHFPGSVYNPKIFNRISNEEYRFVLKQFRTPAYIGQHKGNVPNERFFISDDGTARLYLDGFKNTVSAHSQEIIDFFNS